MPKLSVAIFFIALIIVVSFILATSPARAPLAPDENRGDVVVDTNRPASKDDLIVLESPLPDGKVTSPLVIKGKARGGWFFEATFPITLVNWDGLIIAEGYATADGEWMTNDYVPFTSTITFTKPDTQVSDRGWIILHKSNASGEPRFDNALEVQIFYK